MTNKSIVGIIITVGAFIFEFLLISKYFEIRRKKSIEEVQFKNNNFQKAKKMWSILSEIQGNHKTTIEDIEIFLSFFNEKIADEKREISNLRNILITGFTTIIGMGTISNLIFPSELFDYPIWISVGYVFTMCFVFSCVVSILYLLKNHHMNYEEKQILEMIIYDLNMTKIFFHELEMI